MTLKKAQKNSGEPLTTTRINSVHRITLLTKNTAHRQSINRCEQTEK